MRQRGKSDSAEKPDDVPIGTGRVLIAVKKSFRPEFINRLSQIIVFQPLDKTAVREIIDKFVNRLRSRLTAQGVNIALEDSAYELLMNSGFSESYGAREMERTIDTLLAKPLANALLQQKIGPGATLRVSARSGDILFLPTA